MTRYFINEREVAPPADLSSLDQILRHAKDHHLPTNSVIRQINIDGQPLVLDSFPNPGEILKQIVNRDRVEIFTGTVSEIAQESIVEALAYLDRIEAIIPSLASSFQIYPGPESFENLRQFLDGFYWINVLLDKLALNFHVALGDCFVQGISVRDHIEKFIAILRQLVDSQERDDFILIADLLEYEVNPIIPIWKGIFGLFLEKTNPEQLDFESLSNEPIK
jgi:hypothetical protein